MTLYFLKNDIVCSGKLLKEYRDKVALEVDGFTKIFGKNDVFFQRQLAERTALEEFIPKQKFQDGEQVMYSGTEPGEILYSFFNFGEWMYWVKVGDKYRMTTNESSLRKLNTNIKQRGLEIGDTVFFVSGNHYILGKIIGYEEYSEHWLYQVKSGEREFEAFEKDLHKY